MLGISKQAEEGGGQRGHNFQSTVDCKIPRAEEFEQAKGVMGPAKDL
jgi:hypothetical protein